MNKTICQLHGCQNVVAPSKSRNQAAGRDFCSRPHKDAHGSEARTVGRRVIAAVPVRPERDELIEAMEKIRARQPGARVQVKAKRPPVEQINLGAMTPQDRRRELCRVAGRLGILS